MLQRKPHVVVVGGGTGVFTVLSGLRQHPLQLTAVVSMADDGGSTGVLREEFGVLPPGDVRRALVALARADQRMLAELFNHRFSQSNGNGNGSGLNGHTFGNLMLTALEQTTGSFERAVDEAARILGCVGEVLPVTLDDVRLVAELEDGSTVRGETNIDLAGGERSPIAHCRLEPAARINPRVDRALRGADLVVLAPGDLYTSLVPNLLVDGVSEALSAAKHVTYVVNVMTKRGETDGFTAADFVQSVESYLMPGTLDSIVVNVARPSTQRLATYEDEHASVVDAASLADDPRVRTVNLLRARGYVRHDPARLARALVQLLAAAPLQPAQAPVA